MVDDAEFQVYDDSQTKQCLVTVNEQLHKIRQLYIEAKGAHSTLKNRIKTQSTKRLFLPTFVRWLILMLVTSVFRFVKSQIMV